MYRPLGGAVTALDGAARFDARLGEWADALREAGAEVLGIASIFSYGMQRGLERLAAAQVRNISLSDFDALCEVASEEGYIQKSDIERLLAFRANPSDESWMRKA